MANRASASIVIGGTLRRHHLPMLVEVIEADGLCLDYGDRRMGEADILSGFPLYGAATDVTGASFDTIESFCQEHNLHYVRRSDGSLGAWDPCMDVFTGSGEVRSYASDSSGTVMLTIDEIRDLGSITAIMNHCAPALRDTGPLIIIGENGPSAASG